MLIKQLLLEAENKSKYHENFRETTLKQIFFIFTDAMSVNIFLISSLIRWSSSEVTIHVTRTLNTVEK